MEPSRQSDVIEDTSKEENKAKKAKKKSSSNSFEDGNSSDEDDKTEEESTSRQPKKKLSLDQYLQLHTSEDNESFNDIQEASVIRHRIKYGWLYKDENAINNRLEDKLKVPSIEQQASGGERPLAIDTWTYKNQNHCMYVPEGKSKI